MKNRTNYISDEGYPYKPCRLVDGKELYLVYYVFDHYKGDLVRKRLYANDKRLSKREQKALLRQKQIELDNLLKKGYSTNKLSSVDKEVQQAYKTLKTALDLKLTDCSDKTESNYRSYLNIFRDYLEEKKIMTAPIQNINKLHILKYLDWLWEKKEQGNRTRNNNLQWLRTMFNFLIQRQVVSENPTKGIPYFKTTPKRNVAYSLKEKTFLEAYLLEHNFNLFLFTRFIYYGFFRPVEVCRLQIEDLDIKNRVILIPAHKSKNKKPGTVVINPNFGKILDQLDFSEFPDSYYIFGGFKKNWKPGPKEVYRNRFSEAHSQFLKDVDMYDGLFTLYSWKHTGNIQAYRNGLDIYSIMRQNRHHSLDETQKYLRDLGLIISEDLKNTNW